ncbi:hypothetical protein [Micromonospora sp. NPDC005189]|uniref:hypothetical protein n=1 Tax=unclassified Micromonospora TaxID=2617518 RepID=UPI0033B33741
MDATADDRLRSAVLFGAAVAVLAVGGWWWHAAAPASTAASAGPSAAPAVGPSVSTPLDRALAAATPDERVTFRVDSETGEAVSVQGSPGASIIDPATGLTMDTLAALGASFQQADPSGELSRFRETIWREQATLSPGASVIRQSADDGGRYLLQYRCTRPGEMLVVVTGARITGPSRIDCDGAVATAELSPISGPIRVSLSTLGDRPVDAEAQLVALP